jgi:hypothetical protein
MSGSLVGTVLDVRNLFVYKAFFSWSGSPTGTVKIQGSLDNINWYDIASASQATGGTSGTYQFSPSSFIADLWIRPAFTFTSGTGTLQCTIGAKG